MCTCRERGRLKLGKKAKGLELCQAARERHFNTASELLGTHAFPQIHPELEADFNGLDELLRGIVAVGELTLRTTDNIAGFGERVSSKIAAAAFSTLARCGAVSTSPLRVNTPFLASKRMCWFSQ